MTALHPERGTTVRQLRWVAPAGTFPVDGEVVDFGPHLGFPAWLASAHVESARILVADVREGASWAELGDVAWTFVQDAVERAHEWSVHAEARADQCEPDDRLRGAVCGVLDGPFGDFVASHSGRIELVDARDGVVRVRLAGACRSCSLSEWTIRLRLERDIRVAAGPDFAELVVVA